MARNRTVQRRARQLQRRAGGGFNAARDQVVALPPLRARLTHEEWLAAGRARFGTDDLSQWSALCPRCGHVTSVARFAEVSGTTELTQAQRIRQRAVVEPSAWHGVARELRTAVGG
ncbi:hypothetical protein ACFVV7_26660 [Streptomyces globisporus]|uniref:hypothetical protein n=1 Tax=Streptomyces globisporus TaxID=1908 RepID=UPI0036D7A20F